MAQEGREGHSRAARAPAGLPRRPRPGNGPASPWTRVGQSDLSCAVESAVSMKRKTEALGGVPSRTKQGPGCPFGGIREWSCLEVGRPLSLLLPLLKHPMSLSPAGSWISHQRVHRGRAGLLSLGCSCHHRPHPACSVSEGKESPVETGTVFLPLEWQLCWGVPTGGR